MNAGFEQSNFHYILKTVKTCRRSSVRQNNKLISSGINITIENKKGCQLTPSYYIPKIFILPPLGTPQIPPPQ